MNKLSDLVIHTLSGKTLSVAESCTGGGLGEALTAVPGSSRVFVGGIISYTSGIKAKLLNVSSTLIEQDGAVSASVAEAMACGIKNITQSDIAVSVTGLAGPGGDDFGNPVGTVYIGYCDDRICISKKFIFTGDRAQVRSQAVENALKFILDQQQK